MSKIDKLIPEQEEQLVKFREEWLQIGLATGGANIAAITPTIVEFYKRIGKEAPYIWQCKSPLQAQLVINLVRNHVDDTIKECVESEGAANTIVSYGDMRDHTWCAVQSVCKNLEIKEPVTKESQDNILAKVRSLKMEYVNSYLYGSLEAYWIAWTLFPHLYIRPMHTDEQMILVRHWENLARNCFWWYPFEGACFVCDRPTFIGKDERGRMHNMTGAACSFSDGWKMYYVHGVEVPMYVIEHPEQIKVDKIQAERNVEVRRTMIERYDSLHGNGSFILDVGAKLIHSDGFGDLYRVEQEDDEAIVMVKVVNSTPEHDGTYRDYFVRVDPNCKTAHEAVAWTFNKKPEEYAPEIET
jgi:hypothetical protein